MMKVTFYPAHIEVSEQSYYRCRREYGSLEVDQARRLKDLEQENTRLKRAVADPLETSGYSHKATFRFPSEGAISGLNKLQMTVALLMSTGNGAISHMAKIGATICFHGRHGRARSGKTPRIISR